MRAWNEFVPSGRLGRGAFWLRHLVGLPVGLFVCIAADTVVGRPAGFLAALLMTLFLVSVWGRRLHDRGRSAWWLLLAAIPVLGALALIVDCALLGTRAGAASDGPTLGVRVDYRTV
jgi:uncharacterized membrane protein YhaH (DUF805 family)